MTQYQPTFQPDYQSYGGRPPSSRPVSVTTLSIIAIIIGSFGLLCGGLGLVGQLMTLAMGGKNPFAPNAPAVTTQAINAYAAVAGVITLVLAGVLLGGGIGGLKLRPGARRIMVRLSVVTIAWAALQLILQIAWIIPATAERMKAVQAQMDPQAAKIVGSMMGPMQYVMAFVTFIFWCILPAFFLTLWRSPSVIAAFEGGGAATGNAVPFPFPPPSQQSPPPQPPV